MAGPVPQAVANFADTTLMSNSLQDANGRKETR